MLKCQIQDINTECTCTVDATEKFPFPFKQTAVVQGVPFCFVPFSQNIMVVPFFHQIRTKRRFSHRSIDNTGKQKLTRRRTRTRRACTKGLQCSNRSLMKK